MASRNQRRLSARKALTETRVSVSKKLTDAHKLREREADDCA
jgi:hypothetical protein